MKLNFEFSNVCGAVYTQGNVIYSKDGSCVISPVGNRISIFNLVDNSSKTFNIEMLKDVHHIAMSPDGITLVAVDMGGRLFQINYMRGVVLNELSLKKKVGVIKFSPDGKYLAVGLERNLQIWQMPSLNHKDFSPFVLYSDDRTHSEKITAIEWSPNGQYIISCAKDFTCKISTLRKAENYYIPKLVGHRAPIVKAFFSADMRHLYTISKDGVIITWEYQKLNAKRIFTTRSKLYRKGNTIEDTERAFSEAIDKIIAAGLDPSDYIYHQQQHEGEGDSDMQPDHQSSDVESGKEENEMQAADHIKKHTKNRRFNLEQMLQDSIEAKYDDDDLVSLSVHDFHLQWRFKSKNLLESASPSRHTTCAAFHPETNLLAVGFREGSFTLYEMPSFTKIHTLTITTQKKIDCIEISPNGAWLAIGSKTLGQLLVWEWQSESYIFKQQGHNFENQKVSQVTYSPDGRHIASGGDDGKVKIWTTINYFSFLTFTDHTSKVTGISFKSNGTALFSCSLDGTVRAYDLIRYRNFKTFTTPSDRQAQFSCLALDPSGEILAAGSLSSFEIFIWSVQTGRLLDILAGHEGPISALSFSPSESEGVHYLASSSWDKTVRLWDVFNRDTDVEILQHASDVVCVTFNRSGKEIASSCLDGTLNVWDVETGTQTMIIDARRDVELGRSIESMVSVLDKTKSGRYFSTISFNATSDFLVCGGQSISVCIYNIEQRVLVKKFKVTSNRSLDAILTKLNSRKIVGRNIASGGSIPVDTLEVSDSDDEHVDEVWKQTYLPGAQSGKFASRLAKEHQTAMVFCIDFSPDGSSWAAASTQGIFIYSLAESSRLLFDPFELGMDVTVGRVLAALQNPSKYMDALCLSFRLNDKSLIRQVIESIAYPNTHSMHQPDLDDDASAAANETQPNQISALYTYEELSQRIALAAQGLPLVYLDRLLGVIAHAIPASTHLEFYLTWLFHLFNVHGHHLKTSLRAYFPTFNLIQKNLSYLSTNLAKICDENKYLFQFLHTLSIHHTHALSSEMDIEVPPITSS